MVAVDAAKDTLRSGKKQLITMQRLQNLIEKTPPSITQTQLAVYESLKDKCSNRKLSYSFYKGTLRDSSVLIMRCGRRILHSRG